ncbi:hypothetical protein CDAR_291431 [Caerostris darwini]|uniref:Uncharacterized protein n=1 Tax=Caerostris darwini TaxID=1538125 RepID=A0AAV4RJY0_9ARAC|nr:hypothetical protein CDAR_291431 [Caerostris darwini]
MNESSSIVHRLLQAEGYTHIVTEPFKVSIQVIVTDALTFVNGYCNNMMPIMLSLHISCGRMKQDSHVMGSRDFDSHNSHVWSCSNLHAIHPQRHQVSWSVNVWAGMIDN